MTKSNNFRTVWHRHCALLHCVSKTMYPKVLEGLKVLKGPEVPKLLEGLEGSSRRCLRASLKVSQKSSQSPRGNPKGIPRGSPRASHRGSHRGIPRGSLRGRPRGCPRDMVNRSNSQNHSPRVGPRGSLEDVQSDNLQDSTRKDNQRGSPSAWTHFPLPLWVVLWRLGLCHLLPQFVVPQQVSPHKLALWLVVP